MKICPLPFFSAAVLAIAGSFVSFNSAAFALSAGDNVTINAKWQDENAATYNMNGVKITIKDQLSPGGAADITGYLIGGSFTFKVPRTGYTYDVVLSAEFPGVDASGNVVAGGGTGAFTLQDPSTGLTHTEAAGSNLVNYTSPKGGAAMLKSGDLWSAFHGMAEMLREARRRLSLSKNAFTVLFPFAGISSFSPATKHVQINLFDRFDWDVVAHEFGHAIANETSSVNSFAGGGHDGSNQYSYAKNAGTLGNKSKALNLAFNEAFGTWIGGSLLERSDYKGKFPRVGDGKYTDTEDSNIDQSYEDNATQTYFGDDTETAGYQLLFDLGDSSNEANKRTTKIPGLRDRSALGLLGVWNILKGSAVENISDFWKTGFLPGKDIASFLPGAGNGVNDPAALQKALDAAETFAEFGVAPLLFKPARGTKLELTPATPSATNPKFEWSQEATQTVAGVPQAGANADLMLNKFDLVIYSNDLKTELLHKPDLPGSSYTLTAADLKDLKTRINTLKTAGTTMASVKAVIIGKSDVKAPETGPYLSNGVELLLQDFNRAVVTVVDSSGSNTDTDPTNQRVVAAQQSIKNLVSTADAALDPTKVPDIAAAIDFDSWVTILSPFADPDSVVGTLNAIDSNGGTGIDGGINAAIDLLDGIAKEQTASDTITGYFTDRGSILLFTDGQNNDGDAPVIAAIAAATAKSYRVHYGFLNPYFTPKPSTENWAPEPGAKARTAAVPRAQSAAVSGPFPATIQEAVIESGGVFGIISDAASQYAFVQQVFSHGLSNNDEDNAPGGKLVGQTQTTEQLAPTVLESSFEFSGSKDEQTRVVVETTDFRAAVTVYDRKGSILGFLVDTDGDGRVEIPLKLPYSGKYTLQVYSDDGRTGFFSVFVDVQNARFSYTRVAVESENYERVASSDSDFAAVFVGKYSGLLTPAIGDNKGDISFTLSTKGQFTGIALVGGTKVSLRGAFDAAGSFTGVVASKIGDLTLDLKLASSAMGRKIQGTISGIGFSSTINADINAFAKKSNPATVAGDYTFVFPSESDPTIPGDGFGTLRIGVDGNVRLAGVLGDNSKVLLSTMLSPESTFPLNLPIYKRGKGVKPNGMFGEIAVRDTTSGHLDGVLEWTKPPNSRDPLYKAGFSGSVPLIGSRYVKPANNQRILNLAEIKEGNLRASFGTGDLAPFPGEQSVFLDGKNKVKLTGPDPLAKFLLGFNPATGVFSGKLPVYENGVPKSRNFRGVVLQAQNRGSGLFVGDGKTGFAFIEPYDATALRVTSASTASGTKNQFFSYIIQGVNGVVSAGASGLPSWLYLNSYYNTISGTPSETGVFHVTVFVTDNTDRTAAQNLTITIK